MVLGALWIALLSGNSGLRADGLPPVVVDTYPDSGETSAYRDTLIVVSLIDPDAEGVDPQSIRFTVNGVDAALQLEPRPDGGYDATYDPPQLFPSFSRVQVEVEACDVLGNCMDTYVYQFSVGYRLSDRHPPASYNISPPDAAQDIPVMESIYLNIVDYQPSPGEYEHVTGVNAATVSMRINGENVQVQITPFFIFGITVEYLHDTPFPYNSWIVVEVDAADKAGNAMPTLMWSFKTERLFEDQVKPLFAALFPAPNSRNVPQNAFMAFRISDDFSGVDISTLGLLINGEPATGVIDANPDGLGYTVFYWPQVVFSLQSEVVVQAFIQDYEGNSQTVSWRFFIGHGGSTPCIFEPFRESWLQYSPEQGQVRLSWYLAQQTAYRIRLFIAGDPTSTNLDLGVGDYTYNNGLSSVTFALDSDLWDSAATLGAIRWEVAAIDAIGGTETTAYSDSSSFSFVPPAAVNVVSPPDYTYLTEGQSPTFTWNATEVAASYLLAFVRVSEEGTYTSDVFTVLVTSDVTTLPIELPSWQLLQNGYWLWTVIAVDSQGAYSQFALRHFTKIPDF